MGLNSRYEIRVKGILDGRWAAWFEDLQVSRDGEETVVAGPVADQAALRGLLTKMRDLGLSWSRYATSIQIEYRASPTARPSAQEPQEELVHPVIMRQLAAARPAATPIKNTRKESEK